MDQHSLAVFTIDGIVAHEFELAGFKVIYDLFPVGTREEIEQRASGLDSRARQVVVDVLDLAHSLRSVAGYDFKQSLEEKLKFVRAMPDPIFELYVDELRLAQIRRRDTLRKKFAELKKSSPNPV